MPELLPPVPGQLRRNRLFARFWLASTASDFGTYITTVALSVLVLVSLNGTALDQGLINAARWAPYLLLGLLAGVAVDRFPRRTVLIAGDLGRGVIMAVLCVAGLTGSLTIPALILAMFLFGTLSLTSDAAHQSLLPQLVPRTQLVRANARLQQSDTLAQTAGSALAGGLVALISAPLALLVDAVSYLASAAVLATLGRPPAAQKPPPGRERLLAQIRDGVNWVYRHPHLAPLAWSSHLWFVGFAMTGAVVPALVLNDLRLGPLGLGLVLGLSGIGAMAGTTAAAVLGFRCGTGKVMVAARLAQPLGIALVALAPLAAAGLRPGAGYDPALPWSAPVWAAFALAGAGQLLFGFGMGVEGPLERGYRQAVTPDRLIARMSATLRSANRGMFVIGAPLGGLVAAGAGNGAALWVAAAFMLLAGCVLLFSAFRSARVEDQQLTDEQALRG